MLDAIKERLSKCETWVQPHDDITWLVNRVEELDDKYKKLLKSSFSFSRQMHTHMDRIDELEALLKETTKTFEVALKNRET